MMPARVILSLLVAMSWAASADAQFINRDRDSILPFRFPRPHEETRDQKDPHPGHAAAHHRATDPARTAKKDDSTICNNPDTDPDAAISACGRLITAEQAQGGYSLAVAYVHRAQAHQDKGDFDGAIADLSDVIRLKPAVPGYYVMRGAAAEKSGKTDAAQADYRHAVSLDPKNQYALNGLGRLETRSAVSTQQAPGSAPATAVPPIASAAATPTDAVPNQPASAPNTGAGARIALVIGNGAYVNANPLPNPPNDAHVIAGALRDIGFDVQEGENLGRTAMESQLHDFLRKASGASIVLLFYAGHGMQIDGKNYLVPVDAKLAEPSDLAFETIEIDKLLDSLGDPGHTNIILLDACRDNPLARSFASHLPATRSAAAGGGLAAYSAVGTGTLIAYSTAPGQTALDGKGSNSPFTTSLLHNLKTPGLEIRQVLTRVRAEVAAETGNRQIPWDNSSLMGDVILVNPEPPGKTAEH